MVWNPKILTVNASMNPYRFAWIVDQYFSVHILYWLSIQLVCASSINVNTMPWVATWI